jgi:hypothetical protein
MIVALGLRIGVREIKRGGGALRRAQFVGNEVAMGEAGEFAQRRGGHAQPLVTLLLVEDNALSEGLGADGS